MEGRDKLNIFKERNAFHQWLLLNEMSTSGIVLWHALMDICNRIGRKSTFNVPNSTLMKLTGLSKQGLMNARNVLVEKQFIRYEKGKKGCAPVYEIISLVHSIDRLQYQLKAQPLNKSDTDELPIHKGKDKEKRRGGKARENIISIYEQNIGNLQPLIRRELDNWCEKVGEEIVIEAITITLKKGGRTFSYVEKILKEWTDAKAFTLE